MALRSGTSSFRLTLLLVVLALLASNVWYLWNPRAEDTSGDVLIHLIFARNRVNGHPNEFNPGEKSRALTSVSWNLLLAWTGELTGKSQQTQGFLNVARGLAIFLVTLSLTMVHGIARRLGARPETSALAVAFCMVNPITFYWCAANPMETALAIAGILALLWFTWFAASQTLRARNALVLALAGPFMLTTRPELAILAAVAAGSVCLSRQKDEWKKKAAFLFVFLLGSLVWLGVGWLVFRSLDLPFLPNAVSARRLIIQLRDAGTLPLLGIPFNKDAWLMGLLYLPCLAGLARLWRKGGPPEKAVVLFTSGALLFVLLFFSLYFCTTWQGRYLLPVLFLVWTVGIAGLTDCLGNCWLRSGLMVYLVITCLLLLRPLANYAQGPFHRSWQNREYVTPDASVKTLLAQEIQAAWFYPQIHYFCTEGLIALETQSAQASGQSVHDFILELHPDWISPGRYPLHDPDHLEILIDQAATEHRDFRCRSLHGIYVGIMAGCGPVFRLEYESPSP